MLFSYKEKFKKYYKNILLDFLYLYSCSSNKKEYTFIKFNKKYNIKFEYSLSHCSVYINNYEIMMYMRATNIDFTDLKLNGIIQFKKNNKLTYEQLFLLFKKIKSIIKQNKTNY